MPDRHGFDRSSQQRRNTRIVIFVLAVAAVCLAGLGVLLATNHIDATAGTATTAPTTTTPTAASAAEAHQVALALRRLTTDPESLVASASPGPARGHADQGVPAGSTIDVNEASWAPDGYGGGTILVTLTSPGLPPATYAVIMVRETNAWKVLETVPITASTPSPSNRPTR
jgi:hypothetical protein